MLPRPPTVVLGPEDAPYASLAFSPDGHAAAAAGKTSVTLLDGRTLTKADALAQPQAAVLAFRPPDGRILVYKKPLEQEVGWRLHALDLVMGTEHPLNQVRRSVDDQVEWYDDSHIVYHDSAPQVTGVWMLSVDGVSEPQLLLPQAYSPAVQR